MNKEIKKINIEDCLFFDAELCSFNENLELDTKEFELWQWKNRDRETGEFLENEKLQDLYKKTAALKVGFNKIVTIGVGFVNQGQLRIKAIKGTEEEILKEFATYTNHFKHYVSFNGIGFDSVLITANSNKYFDVTEHISPNFNPSGKKPWELKTHCDVMDVIRSTHYTNISFDEACYMYGVSSPKEGDVKGDKVSETYYKVGVEPILDYVKRDVHSLVNLFCAVTWQDKYETFIDASESLSYSSSPLEQAYNSKELTEPIKQQLKDLIGKKKKTKKDKEIIGDILSSLIIKYAFDGKDSQKEIDRKKLEVEQFIEEL